MSAKFHCPTSTVTLFFEDGEGRIHSSPVTESQKRPAYSGGTAVYNYPCYARRRGLMPKGLLFIPKNEHSTRISSISSFLQSEAPVKRTEHFD